MNTYDFEKKSKMGTMLSKIDNPYLIIPKDKFCENDKKFRPNVLHYCQL